MRHRSWAASGRIKVVPEAFARDAERLAPLRPVNEAASLNHPNMAQIYGLEKSAGTTALVMELMRGRRSRTGSHRGRFPQIDEARPIAKQNR